MDSVRVTATMARFPVWSCSPGGRPVLRSAAILVLAVVCLAGGPVSASGAPTPGRNSRVVCAIEPHQLDVARRPGPLVARLEIYSADGLEARDASRIAAGVYVSSVAGTPLPPPDGRSEGIGEDTAARRIEDRADVRGHGAVPNGVPEMVVRFDRPSDGDPRTREDGDAGDILAMLTDVPDGASVDLCLAGQAGGEPFTCCAAVRVRNRGLRDRPQGLHGPGPGKRF